MMWSINKICAEGIRIFEFSWLLTTFFKSLHVIYLQMRALNYVIFQFFMRAKRLSVYIHHSVVK